MELERIPLEKIDLADETFRISENLAGKDYPITGSPDLDAVALTMIDANTIDYVTKKGGKEITKGRSVVFRDGKTMTGTEKGKDGKGRDFTNITVYDKQ